MCYGLCIVFKIATRAWLQKRSPHKQLRYDVRRITFHKCRSRLTHQIEKIWNQTVYCQLKHDINHSLRNLKLKLRDCGWMKNVRLMTSIHDITMGGVTSFMYAVMRASQSVHCMHTVSFLIQHGVDMPCLTSMCMCLTSLNIYKLLTQDGNVLVNVPSCLLILTMEILLIKKQLLWWNFWSNIDPCSKHDRQIMIQLKQDRSWNLIKSRNRGLVGIKLLVWSRY